MSTWTPDDERAAREAADSLGLQHAQLREHAYRVILTARQSARAEGEASGWGKGWTAGVNAALAVVGNLLLVAESVDGPALRKIRGALLAGLEAAEKELATPPAVPKEAP